MDNDDVYIIQCNCMIDDKKLKRLHDDLCRMKDNNLMILPAYFKVTKVPKDNIIIDLKEK